MTVRAFHVAPGMPPPESERHAHDYRLDVLVRRDDVDERGMVVDLDVLNGVLATLVAKLDGADLEDVVAFSGDTVTVEVFARWVHEQVAAEVALPGASLRVRVWESPTAFGGYAAPLPA